jgi:hypothetical protein
MQARKLFELLKLHHVFSIEEIAEEAESRYIIVSADLEYTDNRKGGGPARVDQR